MPETKLRATLTELQTQLDNPNGLSIEDAALLEDVQDKIDRLLEQTQETRRVEAPVIQAQVGGIVERFERDHPELTSLLNTIATTLSSIGF